MIFPQSSIKKAKSGSLQIELIILVLEEFFKSIIIRCYICTSAVGVNLVKWVGHKVNYIFQRAAKDPVGKF